MQRNIILKFANGQSIAARLPALFSPTRDDIEVIQAGSEMPLYYSLHDLSCILWLGKPTTEDLPQPGGMLEDVQTVTCETYSVYTLPQKKYANGFFGIPAEPDSPYQAIFFVGSGVRQRSQQRHLGEILVEQGFLPPTAVVDALAEQEHLRQRRAGEVIATHSHIPLDIVEKTLTDAEANPNLPRNARVGDILVDAGLISREEVEAAMAVQQDGRKKKIGELLIERGLINEAQLLSALATKFGMRFVDLENQIPGLEALSGLSRETAVQLQVLPFQTRKGALVVATAQPNDPTIGDHLRLIANRPIELVVARSRQIAEAIERFYPA